MKYVIDVFKWLFTAGSVIAIAVGFLAVYTYQFNSAFFEIAFLQRVHEYQPQLSTTDSQSGLTIDLAKTVGPTGEEGYAVYLYSLPEVQRDAWMVQTIFFSFRGCEESPSIHRQQECYEIKSSCRSVYGREVRVITNLGSICIRNLSDTSP